MDNIFVAIFITLLFIGQIVSSVLSTKLYIQGDENLSNTFLLNSTICMVGVLTLASLLILLG